jgi:hypothetical protein
MKISYAITVNDEYEELQRLYKTLKEVIRPEDEIVVQQDWKNGDFNYLWPERSRARAYLLELEKLGEIKYTQFDLNDHFADFKNNLSKVCTGDFIFQIDADEYPCKMLIDALPDILKGNPLVDVYVVPRVNTVEGLTPEHIQKWGWVVDKNGVINFPDYQWRIYRNNGTITWKNKVHEVLEGHKQFAPLPSLEEYCLYHPKTITKQELQNAYYDKL